MQKDLKEQIQKIKVSRCKISSNGNQGFWSVEKIEFDKETGVNAMH